MSRPSDPRYANHPLKLLRDIAGLSQPDFARVTGISLDTIRAVEIGRRNQGQLSKEIEGLIAWSLGAGWQEGKWVYLFFWPDHGSEAIPYTREHYQTFREELLDEARDRQMTIYYQVFNFLCFCEAIPAPAYNGWFWRLERLLRQWHEEVKFPGKLGFDLHPHWDRKAARVLGYRKVFPELLQGEEKRFEQLIENARRERQEQQARSDTSWADSVYLGRKFKQKQTKKTPRSPQSPAGESKNTP